MTEGLSANLQHLETSATIAISAEAKRRKAAGEDVIDLGAGEPDFPTPPLPAEAGIRAISGGKTHYSANEGILELRAAAATHLSLLSGGRPVNADHIVVSNGSKQSLFNACFTLFGPGDVVAIPSPAWVSYPQIVHLARARPVMIAGDPEWSLKASVKDLERMLPGATGLILCSPCNPTGAVYTHAEIRAIAQWAKAKQVWVIADEIYRRIHYGTGPAPSFLDLPDDLLERVVLITGVSKTYAMTGWRIGFALAPAKIAKAMAALQSHTTTGANHPAQYAAAAALGDERVEQDVTRMVNEFRKRRDLVVGRFRQDLPGVEFVDPLGAFYFFFRVDSFGKITGTDFCTRLITQSGVALVPGAAFGDDRWVRLSYAASTDSIKQALDRIVELQFRGPVRQHLNSVRRHHTIVFDPNPKLAELIDTGLIGKHDPGLHAGRIAFHHVRRLVTIHAHAVAQPVREVLAVPRVADDLAGRPVHLLALRHIRLGVLDGGGLRVMHDVVDLLEFIRRRIAEPDGARDVRRVSLDSRAGIDQHDGLAGEPSRRWSTVRQRARLSELHQATARRAPAGHFARQERGDVPLGHPDGQLRECRGNRSFRSRDRLTDQGDLFRALDDAQSLRNQRAVLKSPARQRAGEPPVALVGSRRFDAHNPGRTGRFGNEVPRIFLLLPAARIADDGVALDALHLERRAHDDRRPARRHHQEDETLAPSRVVAGEVLEIGARLDDEEVELARLELVLRARDALREYLRAERGCL